MATAYEPLTGRIPIRDLRPQQPGNLWPAKAFCGEVVPFSATIFAEGHDLLGASLLLTSPEGVHTTHPLALQGPGTDRYAASVVLDEVGEWSWSILAYRDDYATWLHAAEVKIPAGLDTAIMVELGHSVLRRSTQDEAAPDVLHSTRVAAEKPDVTAEEFLALLSSAEVRDAFVLHPAMSWQTLSEPLTLRVERTRAGVGKWYEFFPRSEGARRRKDGGWKSGTLRSAAKRLPGVAAQGFDVLYLPPIHPIGNSFRKGPNNTLVAGPFDPGSPWAIGSADGGHDAIHPDLGTFDDFRFFMKAAQKNGIEVALDLALQCSPDHPWVQDHPEWFTTLPDGSIAFAENPPKKYQDIYPLNFDNAPETLRAEVLRIVRLWIAEGVRIFRVDNPHTKPLWFWEWLLHEVRTTDPDVVFLAEAFTRPAMLRALAQVGFQQSYTYFTWRNTSEELRTYLSELAHETSDYLRPNLFVNTPDILTEYLQHGGPAAFKIRAAIAATGAATWGMYSGFELCESVARPGAEENIDSEKYEYRPRDFAAAEAEGRSLAPYIARLNQVRDEHPALRQLRNLHCHESDNPEIFVFSKHLGAAHNPAGSADTVIVVANVDPHAAHESTIRLDLAALGLPETASFTVRDAITGEQFRWGANNYVRLDPQREPVHVLIVHHESVTS